MIYEALCHAFREYPRESCGLVVRIGSVNEYFECRNLASENDHFVMDPEDYAKADQLGEIIGLVHSHPDAPALPSQYDIDAQAASGLPWHIVSVPSGKWHTFGEN